MKHLLDALTFNKKCLKETLPDQKFVVKVISKDPCLFSPKAEATL